MYKSILPAALAAAALLTNGCATVVEGNKQSVHFNTAPPGATCDIRREGAILYHKVVTPATLSLEKDKDPLEIRCNKEGFRETVVFTDSSFAGWTLGNLLLGGIIGVGVDAASGAINEYPSQVVIPLEK